MKTATLERQLPEKTDSLPLPSNINMERLIAISNGVITVSIAQLRMLVTKVMYEDVDTNELWDASLNAHTKLNIDAMNNLHSIDLNKVGDKDVARRFNQHLSDAISTLSTIWAGKHRLNFPIDKTRQELATLVIRVKEISPNHRFPINVCLDSLLKV